jgi:mannose-1-phosphate guanylyltransferase
MSERLWAIVLAGGEGTRLAQTALEMHGKALPKQFLSFGAERTMLQSTLERLQPLIPLNRMVVIVPEQHAALAADQLAGYDGVEMVLQPGNVGTGPGVLLPLLHVLRRDPQANVALVPSDHAFVRPDVMLAALAQAERAVDESAAGTVLLGATADNAARDLGWIVTEDEVKSTGARSIRRFVEKPPQATADALYAQGALWNTMLAVARGASLWRLARHHLPRQAALFGHYVAELGGSGAARRLREVYSRMPSADFSRDLIGECRGLAAMAMVGAGWSDCGTPERLASALSRGPRLARTGAAAPARSGTTPDLALVAP